jgi:hypothetical protein
MTNQFRAIWSAHRAGSVRPRPERSDLKLGPPPRYSIAVGRVAWIAGTAFCCGIALGGCAPGTSPDASKAASVVEVASAEPEGLDRSALATDGSQAMLAVGACCDLFRRLDSNGVCRLFSNNCQ